MSKTDHHNSGDGGKADNKSPQQAGPRHGAPAGPRRFHIHLVSDATGTTLQGLVRACLAQFDNIEPLENFCPLIRTDKQLDRVIADIEAMPGPVFFTLVDEGRRVRLQKACKALKVPGIPVLDPLIRSMSAYLNMPSKGIPGLQHALDDAYFHRIDAMDFAMSFDDGQSLEGIEEAEVILVGVSRTSKTPTCIFLARRGIMAANVPYVPGVPFPEKVLRLKGPVIVALTESADRLIGLRRNRLKADEQDAYHTHNAYLDPEKVEHELREARRFFTQQGWPVIDVTKRSIEETAAEIQVILQRRRAEQARVALSESGSS